MYSATEVGVRLRLEYQAGEVEHIEIEARGANGLVLPNEERACIFAYVEEGCRQLQIGWEVVLFEKGRT